MRRFRLAWFVWVPIAAVAADTNDIPPLRPPRGEIGLTYWQQHGWLCAGIAAAALATFACVILLARWLMRARPAGGRPPEIVACEALERLRDRPEDGVLASEVSRIVRTYLRSLLRLAPGELTSVEFRALMQQYPQLEADLVSATTDFLRRCDEQKFAPAPLPLSGTGAVVGGLRLVGKFETRRRQSPEGWPGARMVESSGAAA
jgi:hypothetical protein